MEKMNGVQCQARNHQFVRQVIQNDGKAFGLDEMDMVSDPTPITNFRGYHVGPLETDNYLLGLSRKQSNVWVFVLLNLELSPFLIKNCVHTAEEGWSYGARDAVTSRYNNSNDVPIISYSGVLGVTVRRSTPSTDNCDDGRDGVVVVCGVRVPNKDDNLAGERCECSFINNGLLEPCTAGTATTYHMPCNTTAMLDLQDDRGNTTPPNQK
ncbi:hypothetical protein CBL_01936 [Carabus blaptoides fortunei]